MELGSGAVQEEGLQYVGHLVVRGWFLKWNCFFIVWVRQLADFRTRWCVEAGGLGTKLDLRRVLWSQWGVIGVRRDFLWLSF